MDSSDEKSRAFRFARGIRKGTTERQTCEDLALLFQISAWEEAPCVPRPATRTPHGVHDGASNAVGTRFGLDLGFASPKCLVCVPKLPNHVSPHQKGGQAVRGRRFRSPSRPAKPTWMRSDRRQDVRWILQITLNEASAPKSHARAEPGVCAISPGGECFDGYFTSGLTWLFGSSWRAPPRVSPTSHAGVIAAFGLLVRRLGAPALSSPAPNTGTGHVQL